MKTKTRSEGWARLSATGIPRIVKKSGEMPPLSKARLARFRRSSDEAMDTTRYIIIACLAGDYVLHYRVEDGGFGSHPSQATLFKRIEVARAVRDVLFDGRQRSKLKVARGKKTKAGIRFLDRPKSNR